MVRKMTEKPDNSRNQQWNRNKTPFKQPSGNPRISRCVHAINNGCQELHVYKIGLGHKRTGGHTFTEE